MSPRSKVTYTLLGISLFCSLTSLSFLSLVIICVFITLLIKYPISYFYKLLLATCVLFATNSMVAGICFISGLPFLSDVILAMYSILLLIMVALGYISPLTRVDLLTSRRKLVSLLCSFGLSFGFVFILINPMINESKNHYDAFGVFALYSDNISHVELLKAVEGAKGYFYEPPSISNQRMMEGLSGYPQGLHINMYFLEEIISPIFRLSSNYKFIVFIEIFCATSLVVLFGLFFLLSSQQYSHSKSIYTMLLPATISLFLFTGVFFDLFKFGSHSQISSLALFLGMISFYQFATLTESGRERNSYTILALLLLGSLTYTWQVILPVAGIVTLYYLYKLYMKELHSRAKEALTIAIIASVLCGISLIQIYVQLNFASGKSPGINESGFSITPNLWLMSMFILSTLLLLMLNKKVLRAWLPPFLATILVSGSILIYQLSTVGEPRYYLYKSLYSVILIASIVGCLVVTYFISIHSSSLGKIGRYRLLGVVVLLTVASIMYNITNPSGLWLKRTTPGFSSEVSATMFNGIEMSQYNSMQVISVGSCNRASDYLATRLSAALGGSNDHRRQALLEDILQSRTHPSLLHAVSTYQKRMPEKKVVIISSDFETTAYLEKGLASLQGEETFIDLDFGHISKNVATCPEAVR